jgi:hypothetical protein
MCQGRQFQITECTCFSKLSQLYFIEVKRKLNRGAVFKSTFVEARRASETKGKESSPKP